ncbi:cytochrome c biogenesis protein CcsA [Riemerella anatipestifer]|uniref:cytochrome c biogenesis protein CcsA n=1 Tax=Riemerella anatipestifer TaxID=34085 RepID=UPI000D69A256|nr:cytochrome c biogenesis protein CcsA [Riemerella anatipestifer]MRM85935.1 cytochrome C assembly protein [Riemerella anatipestifer]WPC10008.1 cytochrome c biogenesis protein CcsA [Riemerella anatipestifer]WPC12167.1 cytochrome c biogenesis protein CcsA [Riemerella anatipestifer]WPC15977.1 cytochrome c biogenesis protein CcsA [Riemerella anatipestifer]
MWSVFSYIVFSLLILWVTSGVLLLFKKKPLVNLALGLHLVGIVVLGYFISNLWITLERPPLRTLAETRIWYAFFISVIGWVLYFLYKQKWILHYAIVMAGVFTLITYFNPDTINKTLMPALHSVWFIPHVVVYIFAYAMFGMATLVAVFGLYRYYKKEQVGETVQLMNQLVNVGYSFLTLGLLFGALWAKEAWGHYWTWDPKETWAFISWLGYLVYIHYRFKFKNEESTMPFYIIIVAFLLLLVCWFGVNYLPTAQNSVHTYTG